MSGPTPKPPELRQRRNKTTTTSELVDTNPLKPGKVPPLTRRKDHLGQTIPWPPDVRRWWRDIWRSPMAREFTQSDIHGLRMIAELRERFSSKPSAALASEIRLQEQRYGLDPISRRRLQWQIARPSPEATRAAPAPPAVGADPRAQLRAVK